MVGFGVGFFHVCFVRRWKYISECLQGFVLYRRKEGIAREREDGFMTLRYTPVPSACEKHLELNPGMSEVLNYRSVHGDKNDTRPAKKHRCYQRKPTGLAIVACHIFNSYYVKSKVNKNKMKF